MRRALLMGLAVWLVGCQADDDAQRRERVLRVDSSGVEIVNNMGAVASLPVRTLSELPELEVAGDEETGVILYQVAAVTPLSNGRIAVGINGSKSVSVFGSEGELIASMGREGDGPGEFRSVQGVLGMPGDSLGVYDSRNRRLTVFAPDRSAVRTVDLSEYVPARGFSRVHSLPGSMAFVGVAGIGGRRAMGTYRDSATSYRVGYDGEAKAEYGEFPGLETVFAEGMVGMLAFGASMFSETRGDRLVVGLADTPELREFGPSGALARVIRWPDHDREVTADRNAEFVEYTLKDVSDAQRAQMRTRFGSMPYSAKEPAYFDLVASNEGTLWVGDYPGHESILPVVAGPARRWIVINDDGTLREVVETPPGFRLMAVADEEAFGVYLDDLGVETVRVYSVLEAAH